jgi:hypothetical protein
MAITEKYASTAGAGAKDGVAESSAWDWATMLTAATAGNRINFLGNHTLTANAAFTGLGTLTSPLILRAYKTTIGDLDPGGAYQILRTNGNGLLITTNMPTITGGAYKLTMPTDSVIANFVVTSSSNAPALTLGTNCIAFHCYGTTTNIQSSAGGIQAGNYCHILDCDTAILSASGGLYALNANLANVIIGGHHRGGTGIGMGMGGSTHAMGVVLTGNVAPVRVTNVNSNCVIYDSTIVLGPGNGATIIDASTRLLAFVGCRFTDNVGNAINIEGASPAVSPLMTAFCRFDRNGAVSNGATDWMAATGWGNVNTNVPNPDNEYVNDGAGDYRILSTAPGIGVGVPRHNDIGALQRAEPTLPPTTYVFPGYGFGDGGTELTGAMPVPNPGEMIEGVTCGPVAVEIAGTYHTPGANEVWHTAVFGEDSGTGGTKIATSIPTSGGSGTLAAPDIITGVTVDPGANQIVGSAAGGGTVIVVED